jgi:CRISPR-associated endonuclease/helicase Cas3
LPDAGKRGVKTSGTVLRAALSMADGVEPWMAIDYGEVLQALAE